MSQPELWTTHSIAITLNAFSRRHHDAVKDFVSHAKMLYRHHAISPDMIIDKDSQQSLAAEHFFELGLAEAAWKVIQDKLAADFPAHEEMREAVATRLLKETGSVCIVAAKKAQHARIKHEILDKPQFPLP